MSKNQVADRNAAIETVSEAIVAVMYAIQGDPDEEFAPHLLGPQAAYAAICALESAGFTVERRAR